jgi:hypothetical protein
MASRESAYPPLSYNPLFVPVDPSDDLLFKRESLHHLSAEEFHWQEIEKVRTIKAVITELEDVHMFPWYVNENAEADGPGK